MPCRAARSTTRTCSSGARGTGKTSVAKILARSLNCVNGPTLEPCGECESCTSITNSTSLDVIEMDAASNNSVDDIRDLREKVGFAPSGEDSWKVYILDEAHMLSTQAWNAFLKTLEEPPPNTIFVLATTEAAQGPADDRRPLPPLRLPAPVAGADHDGPAAHRRRRGHRGRRARARDDRPLGRRQLPRRDRHARPARHLRRQAGLVRRGAGAARRRRRGPDLRGHGCGDRPRSRGCAAPRAGAERVRPRPRPVHARPHRRTCAS